MSLTNVSSLSQRIKSGAESGHIFARFINLLLIADCRARGTNYISSDDAAGDYRGVDGIERITRINLITQKGYQFKFYNGSLDAQRKHSIRESIQKAISQLGNISEWIIVTPDDWLRFDQHWFGELKSEFEFDKRIEIDGGSFRQNFKLSHWGHSQIVELSLRYPHLGRQHFPELFKDANGEFRLVTCRMDIKNTNWVPSKHGPNWYYQDTIQKIEQGENSFSSDPIFDFHFINNSDDVFLLNSICVRVHRTWTTLKGLRQDAVLKSIGMIDISVDFNKEVTELLLEDPLIFNPKTPTRFNVRISDFAESAIGNWAELSFDFIFSNGGILKSPKIILSH